MTRQVGGCQNSFHVTASYLVNFREQYYIMYNIELLAPSLDEQACLPRQGYIVVSEFLLKAGFHLPLHPFLKSFLGCTSWLSPSSSPMLRVGTYFLWKETFLGEDMPFTSFRPFFNSGSWEKEILMYSTCSFSGTHISHQLQTFSAPSNDGKKRDSR